VVYIFSENSEGKKHGNIFQIFTQGKRYGISLKNPTEKGNNIHIRGRLKNFRKNTGTRIGTKGLLIC
jgi:hypothetical protein